MNIIVSSIAVILFLCYLFPSAMLPIIFLTLLVWKFGWQLTLGAFGALGGFLVILIIRESLSAKSKAKSDKIKQKEAEAIRLKKEKEAEDIRLKEQKVEAEAKAKSDEEKRRYSEAVKLKRQQFKDKMLKQQEEYKTSQLLIEAEQYKQYKMFEFYPKTVLDFAEDLGITSSQVLQYMDSLGIPTTSDKNLSKAIQFKLSDLYYELNQKLLVPKNISVHDKNCKSLISLEDT